MCNTEARHSCVLMLPAWRRGAGGSGQQPAKREGGSRGSGGMEDIGLLVREKEEVGGIASKKEHREQKA